MFEKNATKKVAIFVKYHQITLEFCNIKLFACVYQKFKSHLEDGNIAQLLYG